MTTSNAVLCATDFSEHSDQAVRFASDLARQLGATLLIVHVVSPDHPDAAASNEQLHAVPGPIDVTCEHVLRRGELVEEIVRLADEMHASRLVIGTRGRRQNATVTMGHTARRLVDQAPCPVTVVRDEDIDS